MKAFDEGIAELERQRLAMAAELLALKDQIDLLKAARLKAEAQYGVIKGYSPTGFAKISDFLANCKVKHIRTADSLEIKDEL